MSKIDELYESYNTRNDSYTARIRAAKQLIEREDKIIVICFKQMTMMLLTFLKQYVTT